MVRLARPDELEAVGELVVRAYREGGHLSATSDYARVLRDAADRADHADLLVAVDGDKLLGSVTAVRHGGRYADVAAPGEMEFRMLAVAPEAAGRGTGRALVRAVIDMAREEGLRRVVLSSQDSMTFAHRLYRSLGFRRTAERDWAPVPDLQLLAFTLDLD